MRKLPRSVVVVLCIACVNPAYAAWDIMPSFSASTTYSDNVTLAPKGAEEEEYVVGLRPAVSVQSNASDMNVNLIWSLEALMYKNDDSRNRVIQSLDATADAALVQDLVFMNASARARRQLIDLRGGTGPADTSVSDAFGDVRTYTLSPYVAHALSNIANYKAGVNYEWVDFRQRYRDTRMRSYFADISSGPRFTRTAWAVAAHQNEIWYETGPLAETHSAVMLSLRDQFLPNWALTASVGYEKNDYAEFFASLAEPDGRTWIAGISWRPTPRVEVEAGGGEQIFGHSNYAKMGYRKRYLSISADYSETLTTLHELQIENSSKAVLNPATGQLEYGLPLITDTRELFVRKQTNLAMDMTGTKWGAGLRLMRDRRHMLQSGGTETASAVTISSRWTPSPRSTLDLRYGIQRVDFIGGRGDVLRTTTLDIARTISPAFTTTFSLQRYARDTSSPESFDYIDNVATLSANLQF